MCWGMHALPLNACESHAGMCWSTQHLKPAQLCTAYMLLESKAATPTVPGYAQQPNTSPASQLPGCRLQTQ